MHKVQSFYSHSAKTISLKLTCEFEGSFPQLIKNNIFTYFVPALNNPVSLSLPVLSTPSILFSYILYFSFKGLLANIP